jgi:type VI secretion system protein
MSVDRTLLERLARPRDGGERSVSRGGPGLVRSVVRNLQRILNSRVGSAPAQPDLGMPAPSDIAQAAPDAVNLVMQNLRACIEKYEPRLTSVEIAHVEAGDDVLCLRFQVTGRLVDGTTLSLDTLVNPNGRIQLQD